MEQLKFSFLQTKKIASLTIEGQKVLLCVDVGNNFLIIQLIQYIWTVKKYLECSEWSLMD